MQIGSDAHKALFCRWFHEGHRRYEAHELPWPAVDDQALALLRGLPFWTHALQAEEDAGPMIRAVAALEGDRVVREALELQAYEETRHAHIIRHMIARYDLHADEPRVELPRDVVEGFIDFGFEECLDSFGAFGLFKLAREEMLVPDPLFEIFDHVMEEEARHIVFFINWFAYRQANLGAAARTWRPVKGLWHYGKAVRKLLDLVRSDDTPEGKDFLITGATEFVDNLTPRLVLATCLAENERRLAGVDRRLLVPALAPRLAAVGLRVLELVPRGGARAAGDAPAAARSP